MPYRVVGNCVHKIGEVKPIPGGCHDTPGQAREHMMAIMANEDKALGYAGFKALPDGRWVGLFSNIFYDRDVQPDAPRGERFTYGALKEAAEWMNDGHMPVLELFHLDNLVVGQADKAYVAGPFIVAEGIWNDDEIGQKAREYFEKTDKNWRMSHGFNYFSVDRVYGEYQKFRPRELTVLPEEWAANLLTFFVEGDMKGLREDITAMVAEVLHIKPEEAKTLVEQGEAKGGKALAEGEQVGQKDVETEAASEAVTAETTDEEATPPTPEATPEPEPEPEDESQPDEVALALVDALTELAEERRLRAELAEKVKALEDTLAAGKELEEGLEARVKALESAEKEREEMLPKAIRSALNLSRRADGDSKLDDKKAKADIEEREAGLKGEPSFENDPIGWTMKKAGVV